MDLVRGDEWNRLATVLAIDVEIAIQRPDHTDGVDFRHAHEAGIGEGQRSVGVAAQEIADGAVFGMQIEVAAKEAGFDEGKNLFRFLSVAFQQKARLGDRGVAGEHVGRSGARLFGRPAVLSLAGREQGDNGPGVHNPGLQRP